ncbi:MAG: hypothetical protein Q3999_07035 [Buchananella hordeovulneris]|nr:hypothetical protein [Buchananella hordeovulneris]
MIIWRGWGIASFVSVVAGYGITLGILRLFTDQPSLPVFLGLGGVLGGGLTWLLGHFLNVLRVRSQVAAYASNLREALHARAEQGVFQAGPGVPVPTNAAEAAAQIEYVVSQHTDALSHRLTNQHTLFFVPVQYVGILVGVVSVVAAVFMALK